MTLSKCESLEEFIDILRDQFNLSNLDIKLPNYSFYVTYDTLYDNTVFNFKPKRKYILEIKKDKISLLRLALLVDQNSNLQWTFEDYMNKENNFVTPLIEVAKSHISYLVINKVTDLYLFDQKRSTIQALIEDLNIYDDLEEIKEVILRTLKYIERKEKT